MKKFNPSKALALTLLTSVPFVALFSEEVEAEEFTDLTDLHTDIDQRADQQSLIEGVDSQSIVDTTIDTTVSDEDILDTSYYTEEANDTLLSELEIPDNQNISDIADEQDEPLETSEFVTNSLSENQPLIEMSESDTITTDEELTSNYSLEESLTAYEETYPPIYNEEPLVIDNYIQRPLEKNEHTISADILFTQDMKGYEPLMLDGQEAGGIPRLASIAKEAERLLENPVLTFGGDMLGGGLFSAVFGASPYIEAFNELNIAVSGFGSHEFDRDLKTVNEMVKQSDYPMIATNLYLKEDGSLLSKDGRTAIHQAGDFKVGFIGATGEIGSTPVASEIYVEDPIVAVEKALTELRPQNPDAIVLLSQLDNEETVMLMNYFPEITVAFGEETIDDTHQLTDDGRYILFGEEFTGEVLHVHIVKDRQTGKVSVTPSVITVNDEIPDHPVYQEKLENYEQIMSEHLDIEIGLAATNLTKKDLGPYIADAFRHAYQADLGWFNGGGARVDLEAGPLTLRDIQAVLPFGNKVIMIETTGAQIYDALEKAVQSDPINFSKSYPMTAGFNFEVNLEADFGERVGNVYYTDGRLMKPEDTFTVAMSLFVYNGGDGVDSFISDTVVQDVEMEDLTAFYNYITEVNPVLYAGGPDHNVNGENSPGESPDDQIGKDGANSNTPETDASDNQENTRQPDGANTGSRQPNLIDASPNKKNERTPTNNVYDPAQISQVVLKQTPDSNSDDNDITSQVSKSNKFSSGKASNMSQKLPKTGGVNFSLIFGISSLLSGLGLKIFTKKRG